MKVSNVPHPVPRKVVFREILFGRLGKDRGLGFTETPFHWILYIVLSVCIVCLISSYFLYSTVSPPIVKFICSTVDTLFHNCDWSLLVTGSLEGQENKRTRRQSCVSQQSWDDCTFPSYFHPAVTTLLCILYITVSLCSLSGCWFVPFSCVFCFLVLCYLFMSVFVLIFLYVL